MQIVIEISEKLYNDFVLQAMALGESMFDSPSNKAKYAIAKGTVLPPHGRLIDADEYKEHLYACETNGRPLHIMELDERLATVDDVPTILEAWDGENE